VRLRVAEDGKVKAAGASPEFPDQLRQHNLELAALLTGRACRRCGEPIDDQGPNPWLAFADRTAAHEACEDRWEIERVQRCVFAPEAMADPAEVMIHGKVV
jgi:hypothetical protein